jgi:hypothetical protein
MEVSEKLKIDLLYDSAMPHLGMYPKEYKSICKRDTCMPMFIVAIFTISKT